MPLDQKNGLLQSDRPPRAALHNHRRDYEEQTHWLARPMLQKVWTISVILPLYTVIVLVMTGATVVEEGYSRLRRRPSLSNIERCGGLRVVKAGASEAVPQDGAADPADDAGRSDQGQK